MRTNEGTDVMMLGRLRDPKYQLFGLGQGVEVEADLPGAGGGFSMELSEGQITAATTARVTLGALAAGVAAWHGYRRNNRSVGWGALWGTSAFLMPFVTLAYAAGQGWGRRTRR